MKRANKELKDYQKYSKLLENKIKDLQSSNDQVMIYALNKILEECIEAEDYKGATDCRNLLAKLNIKKTNA